MLGDLSAKYESSGSAATISNGRDDPGGKSYGKYQLASRTGSVDSFINWGLYYTTNEIYNAYAKALNEHEVGTEDFDDVWRDIAENDAETFAQMQHDYICYAYYLPAVEALREVGFDADKHTAAMQDVIWSRAVQYGAGQIVEMFEEAVGCMYNAEEDDHSGYPNLSYVDDARFDYDLIKAIYLSVCRSYDWTVLSCRYGLYRRFENECKDALKMLEREQT